MARKSPVEITISGVFLVLVLLLVAKCTSPFWSRDSVTFTVDDKRVIVDGGRSSYLVYTQEETFRNDDIFLLGKFDSSDVFNDIKVGRTYSAEVYWFRIPMFSSYRNIISVDEIESARSVPEAAPIGSE